MDKTAYFEQMRQKRRAEILTAARAMILKNGIDTFNIQQLARELDISTVTLYKYYKNSDDIMLALVQEILQGNDFLLYMNTESTMPLDTFLQTVRNLFAEVMEHREDISLLFLYTIHTRNHTPDEKQDDIFSIYMKVIYETLYGLLKKAKDSKEVSDKLDIKDALDFITNMNQAFIQQIALLGESQYELRKKELAKHGERLIQLFRLYLTSPSD